MSRELCKSEKATDIAKRLGITQESVRENKFHFIGITFEDAITRRNAKRKYGVRYIEVNNLRKVIPNEVIQEWSKEINGIE